MFQKILIFICLTFFTSLRVLAQTKYEEFVETDFIKTLTFYAYAQGEDPLRRFLSPSVVNLNNPNQQLVLEFDDIRAEYAQYKIKIVHCELDGSRSRLLEMEYLSEINELFISDYQISRNTKVPYYHYRYVLPKPKISGNFIMQLYADEQLVAQKKFWVYEEGASVSANVIPAVDPEFWKTHQQVNLKLDFGRLQLGIIHREIKILIRKNQNDWKEINNAHLQNSGQNTFSLQQFSNDYLFKGGNEYRFLDITSSFRKGQNVQTIELSRPDNIYTYVQGSRGNQNYVQSYDNNGGYLIQNIEGTDAELTSDYVNVIFRYKDVNLTNSVFLTGKFTNWEKMELEYNPHSDAFEYEMLLKNGVYDFSFVNAEDTSIEGDFSLTGNEYEVFVFQTSPGKRYSALIGYQKTYSKK